MLKLNEKGQGLVEYLILLIVMSVSTVLVINQIQKVMNRKFSEARDYIDSDVKIKK